jgi:hypothetical protein
LKKTISFFVLSVVLVCALCGCDAKGTGEEPDKLLYDNGLSMIGLMTEMAESEAYVSAVGASSELSDIIGSVSGVDGSAPDKVFKVTVPDGVSAAMFAANGMEMQDMSERLFSELDKRFVSAAATRLNSQDGAPTLAAMSVLTVGGSFLCDDLDNAVIYLYHFTGTASVMITFMPGVENIVSASGSFLMNDILGDVTEEGIAGLLAEGAYLPDCEVTQLQIR